MNASNRTTSSHTINAVEDYGWYCSTGPHSCNYLTPQVIQILNAYNLSRVADLGSGNGALCAALRDIGFDVVGIEYDKQGCAIAHKSYSEIPFYNFGVQDAPENLLEREALFDAVVSTEVIEHLYSPHLLPLYAWAILKDKGILIVSTPHHGYLKNLALSVCDYWDTHHTPLWHGGHIKFWSRRTLTTLLESNGFKVLSFHGVGRIPFFWKSMIIVAQKVESAYLIQQHPHLKIG